MRNFLSLRIAGYFYYVLAFVMLFLGTIESAKSIETAVEINKYGGYGYTFTLYVVVGTVVITMTTMTFGVFLHAIDEMRNNSDNMLKNAEGQTKLLKYIAKQPQKNN